MKCGVVGSFGQGGDYGSAYANGCGGGGGGWQGGGWGGYGGSGYVGGVPSFTNGGTTYAAATSNGGNSGDGKATITYAAKGVLFEFNGVEITDVEFEGVDITAMEFEGTTIF